jgi:uncharacterized protein (TIGR02246 family)
VPIPASTRAIYAQLGEEAIRSIVTAQVQAWNRNDAASWAKDFLEDATFINVRGDLVKGRAAIEKIHAFIFGGPYKASHCDVVIDAIDYPAPNVAIAELSTEITNFKNLPPGLVPTFAGSFRTRLKLVLVNGDSGWKIFAAQNTAIAPVPMQII